MVENDRLKSLVTKWDGYLREKRRHFHEHPELSGKETETSRYIQAEATRLGLTVEPLEGTGFLAILDTGRPGRTLALRADMDALPIQESQENMAGAKQCVSQNPGICHACGHDAHMAIALASMQVLCELKDNLYGKIIFAFEEGEERGSGIRAMTAALAAKKTDAIYGNHVAAFMDSNTVCLDAGPRMAGAMGIHFTLKGKSGHASRPDLSCNPISAGAAIVSQLSAVWTNQMDVTKTVTLSITQFNAGISSNIIPDEARIAGTCRFFDKGEAQKGSRLIRDVVNSTSKLYGCTPEFSPMSRIICDPVNNDPILARQAQSSAQEVMPAEQILHDVTWFASESFSRYASCAPSMFAFIGIRNPSAGSGAEHHNPSFDVDEDALQTGVLMMCKFTVDFLRKQWWERDFMHEKCLPFC